MPRSFLGQLATVRQGAYLLHWSVTDATYHVVFRLADALPAAVVERYRRERAALIAAAANPDDPILRERLREHFSAQIERRSMPAAARAGSRNPGSRTKSRLRWSILRANAIACTRGA